MRNLLLFLAKYSAFFLFIGLEILCFILVIRYNQSQQKIFINSSNVLSATLLNQKQKWYNYFQLQDINKDLADENASLLSQLLAMKDRPPNAALGIDSSFLIISAKVINNSINLRNNNITLNKGLSQNISPGMGVLSKDGIVGIVTRVSPNYSQAISILNSNAWISASIKSKDYFGSLIWQGNNPQLMTMEAVPKHANISVGDSVVTSGYSSIFPAGFPIGVIEKFEIIKGRSYYTITVKLHNDLSKLAYVYVLNNKTYEERELLENNESR